MSTKSGQKTGARSGSSRRDAAGMKAGTSGEERSLVLQFASLAAKAFKLAARVGTSSGDTKLMQESGAYLRDLRELAGLTQAELAEALHLSDQSLLAAVEKGTATLSFELILRLAALLARHDPVPFIIRFTRTYDPEIWAILERWGIGSIPVHFERERQFINIYRGHDIARKLSDRDFERVLQFTRSAFETALHFATEQRRRDVSKIKSRKPAKASGKIVRNKPAR